MMLFKRKMVSALTLTLLLVGMFAAAFSIQAVKADGGTIYIQADGSIYPSDAPISTLDNITYTFTGDINDSIVIEGDNIVVDGAGYTLQGTNAYGSIGTDVTGRSNITIKDMAIKAFYDGIYLNSSSSSIISGNNITDNGYGILLFSSSGNSISGNSITTNNNDGIVLDSSSGNSIWGNNAVDNGYGIFLHFSSNYNSISENNIKDNAVGIYLYSSSNYNSVSGNNITTNREFGIGLDSSSNYNSVSGNYIANNGVGILLDSSSGNSISGNNAVNNWCGIYLHSSSNNSISGNTFTDGGLYVYSSYQNSVANNTVNGRPLVYLEGVSNYTIDDAGQVILVKCNNIGVEDLNLSRTTVGVELWETSNSTISGNDITANNYYGVVLDSSSNNNSICGNYITANNGDGILLYYSSGNSICGNNITANNNDGILLYSSSSYNSISGNNITNNNYGMEFQSSSSYNSIFHNNFINNAQQVYSSSDSVNVWDNGYPSGGNYWSDYNSTDVFKGPYQNETGSDGIGDTPYTIDSNNADRYPLMNLWVRLRGDINFDGVVDIYDAIKLAGAFNSRPGDLNWNPNADINGDNIVDIYDAIMLASHFNQHSP